MSAVSFNPKSARIRKARLHRRVGKRTMMGLWLVIGVLAAAGIYSLANHTNFGWSFLGLAILVNLFQIWNLWELQHNAATRQLTADTVPLDQVIESRLLGELNWPTTPHQIWNAAVKEWEGVFIVNRLGIPYDLVAQVLDQQESADVWTPSISLASNLNLNEIDAGVVATAVLTGVPALKPVLTAMKIDDSDVIAVLGWLQQVKSAMSELSHRPFFGGVGRDWASGYTPTLNRFATNISRQIETGYYRHLPQTHENIVDQLAIQLSGQKASVALVGEVGSGKTAVVYSLAERLLKGEVGSSLKYYYVMQLNAASLISSGARIEDIMQQILGEAIHAKNIIVLLDEAQLFFGGGTGAVDLSQLLLPILQQSPLKLILTMGSQDWQNLTSRNPGLTSSLQRLVVPQPSETEIMEIIEGAAIGIEHAANAFTTYQAIKEVYRLADRYLVETAFPGKGITVLEAAAHYAENNIITPVSVQKAIEATVGTKVSVAGAVEKQQLLHLEDQIHQRMINQTHAVKAVSDALRRARAGVRNQNRPVGSFLFLGPTGVGKTELARALADIYFGGQDQIIRVDMSEYQQPSDIDRLLSPSSGRSGTTLIASIRKQPFSVVLFDEIEKAHPDVLNLLLQLLDEGRLTDTKGRQASFKDAIVIATSNAAADQIREKIAEGANLAGFEDEIVNNLVLSHQFRPELLNRFDDIVLFRPLEKAELRQVVELLIKEVNATMAIQKIKVSLTPSAIDTLVEQGYDPQLGARPMRRMVQRGVENNVAKRILAGSVQAGQQVTLDAPDLQAAGRDD